MLEFTISEFLLTCGCYCSMSPSRSAMGKSMNLAFPDNTHMRSWKGLRTFIDV